MFSANATAVELCLFADDDPDWVTETVDLAPALVLGAQILFGALLGIMGLFLADPIVAMIKVALEREAERNAQTKAAAST